MQKFILVTLLIAELQAVTRQEFSRYVYAIYYKTRFPTASHKAALSRAYRRLENRGFIIRAKGHWKLTALNPAHLDEHSGIITASLELAEHRDKYPHIKTSRRT